MDVDPALASAGVYNGTLKRKADDAPPDERGAPTPRLNIAQEGPQPAPHANIINAMNNGPAPGGNAVPPHSGQGAPLMPPGTPGPNHTHEGPRTPLQRPLQPMYTTPLSDTERPLQIETSGRKVTIACENCRARKTRCDGGIPCARCVRSQTECLYDTERRRRGPHAGSRRTKTGPYSLEDFLETNVKRAVAESSASKAGRQQRQYTGESPEASFASAPGAFPPPSPTKSVKSAKGASASEGETMPNTSKKVTFACQGCRQRKTRCDGCTPCASCARLRAECLYDTERKRRGPRVGYRRGGKAEAVAAAIVLTSQPNLMDPYASKSHAPAQEPVLWAQPEELRPLSPEPPPTQFIPGPSLANLVDAHRTGQVPPPMPPVDKVNQLEGEKEKEDELQEETDYEGDESTDEAGHVEGMLPDMAHPHASGDDRPRRTVGSCTMCRVRKVKCDRVHPQCGSCSQHGQTCRYEMPPKRRKRPLVEDPNPGAPPPPPPPGMQMPPGVVPPNVPEPNMEQWVNQDGAHLNGPVGPPLPPPGMMPLPPPLGHHAVPTPGGPVGSPPPPVTAP
ncbi:hypothetical protein DACRYDRAFT_21608 [Dacryopinax primogenitus]|uniref:Zn(2)-C6 fungal-type domain-containing protein n=1 Tax=Dacryopinax primogenitus (strain DJM 731) TaxID=1858805 RepID=M5G1B8_DACPD|nr:uncharacterized protein DACRYDRAFT_21608 [Dacryopinax primogenitus]EJU02524.1 hypothetical protein DACRYDRAFT_21608 [Dacryopinax primogenitus]